MHQWEHSILELHLCDIPRNFGHDMACRDASVSNEISRGALLAQREQLPDKRQLEAIRDLPEVSGKNVCMAYRDCPEELSYCIGKEVRLSDSSRRPSANAQ